MVTNKFVAMKHNILFFLLLLLLPFCFSCENDDEQTEYGPFLGTWTVNDNCTLSGEEEYKITIFEGAEKDGQTVTIFNLYNTGQEISGTAFQSEIDFLDAEFQGTITLVDQSLSISYEVTGIEDCLSTGTMD